MRSRFTGPGIKFAKCECRNHTTLSFHLVHRRYSRFSLGLESVSLIHKRPCLFQVISSLETNNFTKESHSNGTRTRICCVKGSYPSPVRRWSVIRYFSCQGISKPNLFFLARINQRKPLDTTNNTFILKVTHLIE